MSVPDVQLRQLVYAAIVTRKRTDGFIVNDFEVEETYLPHTRLTDLPDAGKVWVIGLAGDDARVARSDAFERDIPIQIGLQKHLHGKVGELTKEIDRYRELEDQLRDVCRTCVHDHKHFAWTRNEALKDENGMPFNFMGMREQNTLEAYFTAFYKVVLE
ncbi:MAG: hypothetical protein AB7U73_15345 [Pirellulales bacterium]